MPYVTHPTISFCKLSTLSEDDFRAASIETEIIKGYNVYYVYVDNGYSLSAVVFQNGRQLPWGRVYGADFGNNLYRSQLLKRIHEKLKNTLFTPDEITGPLSAYADYCHKRDYLINHYPAQRDYISAFRISQGKEDDEAFARSIEGKTFDPVNYGYFDDEAFVHKHIALYNALRLRLMEKADDYDFYYNAFKYEMYNVEYAINDYQGNYDTLSAFGNIHYDQANQDDNLEFYFAQLKFTDAQRRAYRAARSYILAHSDY